MHWLAHYVDAMLRGFESWLASHNLPPIGCFAAMPQSGSVRMRRMISRLNLKMSARGVFGIASNVVRLVRARLWDLGRTTSSNSRTAEIRLRRVDCTLPSPVVC